MAAEVAGDEAEGVGGDDRVVVEMGVVDYGVKLDAAGLDGLKRQQCVVD